MKNIIKQLKAFGYVIEEKDDYLEVTRDSKASIIITETNHMTFSSCYLTNSNALTNYNGFLRYVNDLNITSCVTTFCSLEKGKIDFCARYLGLYDLSTFAEFIRAWEMDTGHLMDVNKDTDIYLMPEKEIEKTMESYCHTENERAEA